VCACGLGGASATFRLVVPGILGTNDGYPVPFPGADYAFSQDHHAYDMGAHPVHVKADPMRGDAALSTLHDAR
jgi:hypothetical protein